jgi:hypothetical protein
VQLVGGSYCGCACRERAGLEPARVPPEDPKLV